MVFGRWLPGHPTCRIASPVVSYFRPWIRPNPYTFVDHRLNILSIHLIQERNARRFRRRQHSGAGINQHLGIVPAVHVVGQAHVTRPPLGEPDPGHRHTGLCVLEGVPIFDLQPQQ